MKQEKGQNLQGMLAKLQRNRENVPLDVLKTKYRKPYEQLISDIKAEAGRFVLPIATAFPDYIKAEHINAEYTRRIAAAFYTIYADGAYARRIGKALFQQYDVEEVRRLAKEINASFQKALDKMFCEAICLHTNAENWSEIPKIYNRFTDQFWDGAKREWRDSKLGEHENALLIFIKRGGQE